MAFHIRNAETDALARKLAALKKTGLTQAVHDALSRELERELRQPLLVEQGLQFARRLKAKGRKELRRPVDRDFIDSLYEHG